jgi:drug/metabolite transporter (DMT)-like permease
MARPLRLGALLVAAGGLLLGIYALFIRTEPQTPNIGGGFLVLGAYGLIAVGVILLVVHLIERRRR